MKMFLGFLAVVVIFYGMYGFIKFLENVDDNKWDNEDE